MQKCKKNVQQALLNSKLMAPAQACWSKWRNCAKVIATGLQPGPAKAIHRQTPAAEY